MIEFVRNLSANPWFLVISGILTILGFIITFSNQFIKKDTKLYRILVELTKFKIPIILAVSLMLVTFFIMHFAFRSEKIDKVKIGLIVPLQSTYDVQMDAERQIQGLATLLTKKPEFSQNFQFTVYEGSMNADNVVNIIKKESLNGTKYFVVTMSKISQYISENWDTIFGKIPEDKQPIIISTAASSPNISILKNKFYRFYIRSNEEGKVLAQESKKLNLKRISYIAVEDPYGVGAVSSFSQEWCLETNKHFENGLYIMNGTAKDDIMKRILEKIDIFKGVDGIFIAHYGSGIDDIVSCLDYLNIKKVIIATSTITIPTWNKPIEEILQRIKWISCIPKVTEDYKAGSFVRSNNIKSEIYKGDVVHDFTYYTLDRLISSIYLAKENNWTFDEAWSNSKLKEPNGIDFELVKSLGDFGDSKIHMEVIHDSIYFK